MSRAIRKDLLSLSQDDLVALSNRGNVKRAQRELDGNECTGELTENDAGDIHAKWSDGVECHLPAGKVLGDGRCSCAAFGLCRHLIRTVLAYQRQQGEAGKEGKKEGEQEGKSASGTTTDAAVPASLPAAIPPSPSWDPGSITDEELARHYRPAALTKLRNQFEQGVLVELVRGSKPSARFHLQACLLRFLVPGDPRYTHCDCAEPAPCSHVPLAVWAFRRLDPTLQAGILASGARAETVPADLLDEIEGLLLELAEHGLSGLVSAWTDRLTRLENRCREADLVWPAEVLADLKDQQQRYQNHDARFSPERLADLAGELLIRCDAIRHDTGALPQVLIRGTRSDRAMEVGKAKYEGLGCGVHPDPQGAELTAYLQDSDTGNLVVITSYFADPDSSSGQLPKPFHELARASWKYGKGYAFGALGVGTLQLTRGKRTPRFELQSSPLAGVTVQPHQFPWEKLRAPVLVEEWAELDARLSTLPPSSLRPRRLAEDFHVARVVGAQGAQFISAAQTIEAGLLDQRGQSARLRFPFTARGAAGAEKLLALLQQRPADLRFVSGPVQRTPHGLVMAPVALVFQDGNKRFALQPWIEKKDEGGRINDESDPVSGPSSFILHPSCIHDPLADHWHQFQIAVGEVFVLGLQRSDTHVARRWRELQHQGEAVGLARVASRLLPLVEALEQKSHTLHWDWRRAGQNLLDLAALARFSQDLAR